MRRRLSLLVGSLVLTLGCSGDAFTAHPDVVAEAAGQSLSAERVAEILTTVKGIPVTAEAATFVGNLWADYTLLAQAIADGSLETDSATIHDAMWRDVAEFTAGHWFDSLISVRATPPAERIDSAYRTDSVRVFQHVLIRPQGGAASDQAEARRAADRVLAQARGGVDFGVLALENSQEPAAQADSGFLPVAPRGAFVPAFDSAAWRLAPGQISSVVETNYGYHVIRRATDEQARQRISNHLTSQMIPEMEQAYYAELDSTFSLKLSSGAVGKAREALANLAKAAKDNGKLVTFNDGALTVGAFARWIQADVSNPIQGPQNLEAMRNLPDSTLEEGIRQLASRYLFLREAERNGVGITTEEWDMIADAFRAQIDTLKNTIGLGPDVIDPAASEADRRRAAALRVDSFFDRMVTGEAPVRLLPGMLTWTLREKVGAKVNPAGVQHAVALATVRNGGDSAGAGGQPGSQPQLVPAPGGPPIIDGGDGQ